MRQEELMQAGFARVDITPPIGARMTGFADRDRARGLRRVFMTILMRGRCTSHTAARRR